MQPVLFAAALPSGHTYSISTDPAESEAPVCGMTQPFSVTHKHTSIYTQMQHLATIGIARIFSSGVHSSV